MAVSGPIKEHIGFIGNFSLGLSFALLCMFYAIFFVKVVIFTPETSALIGAWKCNFLPVEDIMTDRPTGQPSDRDHRTDGLIGNLQIQL